MSNGFSQGPKKETVYGGPAVDVKPAPAFSSPAPAVNRGTVYNGPTPGGAVYNPPTAPRMPQARAAASTSAGARKGASIFYIIAGFTAANMILIFVGIRFAVGLGSTGAVANDLATLEIANLLAIGVFVLLGIFAGKGSKAAFLIGMLLYGADLLLLVMNHPELRIFSIVIHAIFLWKLLQAFRELPA